MQIVSNYKIIQASEKYKHIKSNTRHHLVPTIQTKHCIIFALDPYPLILRCDGGLEDERGGGREMPWLKS